jgi:hypothetical protein
MGIEQKTIDAAQKYAGFDEDALLVVLGKQDIAIDADSSLIVDPTLNPNYDSQIMGPLDELKFAGRRIVKRWNLELYKLVCGSGDNKEREQLIDALNIGEAAAIAAVVKILLLITSPAVAAPLSVVLVKFFLLPAKEELCAAWGEEVNI